MAIKLTPEDLARLEDKTLANIIRKLNSGKTPTAREQAILDKARTPAVAAPGYGPAPITFAQNWSELATAITGASGVPITRRAIQEWRRDPRYRADCPPDRPDGRKDVAAWLAFMVKHGLKRADDHVAMVGNSPTDFDPEADTPDVIQPPRIGGIAADWNKAGAMIDYERNKLKLETQRGTLLVAAELEVPLGATFVVLSQKFSQFPERVAPQVVGFVDVNEVIGIIRTEIESDLGELHGARYLDVTLARILDELPFDAESTRLLQLVSFEGQDKLALRKLIARVVLETLRTIGARAIAEINGSLSGTPQPLHAQAAAVSLESAAESSSPDPRAPQPGPSPACPAVAETRASEPTPKAKVAARVSRRKPAARPRKGKRRA